MQRPGEAPLFADGPARWPLIVHSGGQNTHGLWHLDHLKLLASHGYIAVDVFHGDGRAPGMAESVALRQLAVRAALDFVLAHPHFSGHVDADRIGAAGTSAGGLTLLSLMGGVRPDAPTVSVADPRIKAGFGLVPFAGAWPTLMRLMLGDVWSFGADHAGLAAVRRPYFAVSAEDDRNVPAQGVLDSARRVGGPAWVVQLRGQTHSLSAAAEREARAWELVFFDAFLRGNAAARALLRPGVAPAGGGLGRMLLSPGA